MTTGPISKTLRRTAMLSCGGGSRGLISCGAWNLIQERDIRFDVVYASSVGALNALLYLQGELAEMNNLWLTIKNKDIYSSRVLSLWKLLTNDASLYQSSPLEKLIRKYLKIDLIKKLPIPFLVGVTNLTQMTSEIKDIRNMEFEEAVKWILASASPPVLFPTVTVNSDEHCDAGILNNYFLSSAIDDGYDTLICLTPTRVGPRPIKNILDVIQATISTASFGYLDRETKAIRKINRLIDEANVSLEPDIKRIDLYLIRPPEGAEWNQGLIDFQYKEDRQSLIQFGYNIAKEALKDLVSV